MAEQRNPIAEQLEAARQNSSSSGYLGTEPAGSGAGTPAVGKMTFTPKRVEVKHKVRRPDFRSSQLDGLDDF
jgi:hypothetical protein